MPACYLCSKTHQTGNYVSHSKKRTKRMRRVNVQSRTIAGKRVKVCTRCIKGLR